MHFRNFLEKFFENFQTFFGPRTPHEADPQKCPPPRTKILATPLALICTAIFIQKRMLTWARKNIAVIGFI